MDALRIYVCVKHVPDSAATITVLDRRRIATNVTFLINPYDEHALTAAAALKAAHPPAEVVALSLGPEAAEATLRSALAMGADRGLLVVAEEPPDSIATARALKAAIGADGPPGIILGGKEAIDTEGGQTLFRLAAAFGMPAASNVVSLALEAGCARVECDRGGGAVARLRLRLPCVLGAGRGLNTPKYPTFPEIVKARKKEIRRLALAELGLSAPEGGERLLELEPAVEARTPRPLAGSPTEIAARLVAILRDEARVI